MEANLAENKPCKQNLPFVPLPSIQFTQACIKSTFTEPCKTFDGLKSSLFFLTTY